MQCPLGRGVGAASSSRTAQPTSFSPAAPRNAQRSTRGSSVLCSNWKTFGPKVSHSDGDAEYYKVSNQLSQQYEWFAPKQDPEEQQPLQSEPEETERQQQQRRQRPEFGLSSKQIAALGLSGPQAHLPDPVSLLQTRRRRKSRRG